MEIYVDTYKQMLLGKVIGDDLKFNVKVPTYPLNTDGIDLAASNVLIERVNFTNHDNAVAVQSFLSDKDDTSPCSLTIIVRHSVVNHGVGMAIRSMPA